MAGSHWTLYAFIYFKVLDQSPPVANETVVDIVTPGCEGTSVVMLHVYI